VVIFFKVHKTCVDVFETLPRFLENLLESENLICVDAARTKHVQGIIKLWFNYFNASFFHALGIYFSRKAEEKNFPVLGAFTSVSLFLYGDNHPR